MNPRRLQNCQHGQGLVEYALILVLVAVVVIVAASLLGQAVQRVYGVISGALGAKYDAVGTHAIEITTAQCIAVKSSNLTGLWVVGNTNEDVANLTGSTDKAVGTGMGGLASPVEVNGPNGFKFHPLLLDNAADLSVCPKAVVIQAKDGAIAVSPVTAVMEP
jgi:pilus assembly protein Flp/PilA